MQNNFMFSIKEKIKSIYEDQPEKLTFKEWLKSDHFQIKGFFIAFVISIIPILIFSVILIAITVNRSAVIVGSLLVYGVFVEILKRMIAKCLANRKLLNSFPGNSNYLKDKKEKRKR